MNFTTFICAAVHITDSNHPRLTAAEGSEWNSSPPHAHFGGFWEAAVKTMNCHL